MKIDQDQAYEFNGAENLKEALGVVIGSVERIVSFEAFIDLAIDDLAKVLYYKEAQRMVDRLLNVAEHLSGDQVLRIIDNSIRNKQVHNNVRAGGQMAELFKRTVLRSAATNAAWLRYYVFVSSQAFPSDVSEIRHLIESTVLKSSSMC